MKKIIILLIIAIAINGIFLSGCTNKSKQEHPINEQPTSNEITVDSIESPIRKYFTTPKIIWTFDDYSISADDYPPHKGFGDLSEKITSYGGQVNIMTYFTYETYTMPYGNEIRNYSVVNDFGWSQNKINKSLEFFKRSGIYPQCHGWNHSEDLNNANLSYAYKIINYTLWNWKNNYNITPNFFLGHNTNGNYNITLALKKFSEKYWTVYGENFQWYNEKLFSNPSRDAPAVDYVEKKSYVTEFDPLFGNDWGTPCKTLKEAQDLYNDSTQGKEIMLIRCHPKLLNGTDQRATENLTLWKEWIDWIYKTHELININHTEAIQYNIDRYNFKVIKNNQKNYTIDLTKCKFDHNILFTNPNNTNQNWTVYNENNRHIGNVQDDTFIELAAGVKYFFVLK